MVAAGDEHVPIPTGLGGRVSRSENDCKRAVRLRCHTLHRRPKPDLVPEAKVVGIGVEVVTDLLVPGKVRIARRHRVVRKRGHVTRRVDLQRLVDRGEPVVVAVPPEPPYARSPLEAVEGETPLAHRLRGGEAGTSGADHACIKQVGRSLADHGSAPAVTGAGIWQCMEPTPVCVAPM